LCRPGLTGIADRLEAVADRLYRWADRSRPEGALSLDEIDEEYQWQAWGWRLN
jgi:hypothetical protein